MFSLDLLGLSYGFSIGREICFEKFEVEICGNEAKQLNPVSMMLEAFEVVIKKIWTPVKIFPQFEVFTFEIKVQSMDSKISSIS